MSSITELSRCCGNKVNFERYICSTPKGTKSNIYAFAMIEQKYSQNLESAVIAGTLNADDVVGEIRELELLGKAVFFPDGTINGKLPKPEEVKKSQSFGSETDPRATGEVKNTLEITYDYFYSEGGVNFFNNLRKNKTRYDLVYWTSDSVHFVEYKIVNFSDIGYEIDGDSKKHIIGGFKASYFNEDGQDIPYQGVDYTKLAGYTQLTIPAPVVPLGNDLTLNQCPSACVASYTKTSGNQWIGGFGFAVTETTSCISWSAFKNCDEELPATASFDNETGILSFVSLPIGKHKFTIVAENTSGVFGSACIEIIVKS